MCRINEVKPERVIRAMVMGVATLPDALKNPADTGGKKGSILYLRESQA